MIAGRRPRHEEGTTTTTDAERQTLDIQGLTISYRRRNRLLRVITDVSLHIRPGEAFGLVGESGCGKTTVAMAVMRYLPPNAVIEAGRILFGQGEDLLAVDETMLRALRGNRMAMVYQDPASALNPSMPVGRQIAEVYRYHGSLGKREAMDAAEAMLEAVRISDPHRVLHRYPHELSGGQQQRIMLAMALATNPELLVLDEPTTGLDVTVEAEVLDLVEHLRTAFDTSILFISHNLSIVARMCERVGVLYAGQLVEEGPSGELFREPRHPYTLALLRCVPRPDTWKDARRLEPIPGSLPHPDARAAGCIYAPRCPIARPRCRTESPPILTVDAARGSRCFFHAEVPVIPASAPAPVLPEAWRAEDSVLLSLKNVTKIYRSGRVGVTAVAGASFALRRGEVLGLVGESGSGKSSLAKCIIGLVGITGGRITFEGAEVGVLIHRRTPEQRRRLQMVFQNPDTSLNPRRTVRRILERAVRVLHGPTSRAEVDRRVTTLVSSVRLQPRHLDLRPTLLSGGEKQRVAIARAFAGSPALVLCDEPTSALDVSVQAAILNLLADLQGSQHVSYILISHDLGVVRYIADRIAVMYLGQIVEIGSAKAVFDPPHHPYTEALLSAMPSVEPGRPSARIKLSGTMPSLAAPPGGCRFHPRCPRFQGDICRLHEPPWQRDGEGHHYRCHITPGDLRRLQGSSGPESG
jgi:peptide/nickel transport system ATP-binding protein